MPYQRIPPHLDEDLREEAERLQLSPEQVLERRYFGFEVAEEVAKEAKEALDAYKATQDERYAMIKAWIESKTAEMGQKLVVEYDIIFRLKGE